MEKINTEIRQEHINFILNMAKDGLKGITKNFSVNDETQMLEVDLTDDIVSKFGEVFPDDDIEILDMAVEWVMLQAIAKDVKES